MAKLTGRSLAYAATLHELAKAEGLSAKGRQKVERGARFLSIGVRLQDPRDLDRALKLAEPLALHTGTPVVIARREGGLVMYQFQLANHFWRSYVRADLKREPGLVAVGLAEKERAITLDFEVPHVGVFGTTGSGKTETMRSMMCGLFETHPPEKLQAVVIDLKGKYTDFRNVAHLRGLPIARDESAIDGALAYVNSELKQREANSTFDGRRVVLVVDEAESIFASKPRMQIAQALVKRGREVRINALFGTQEPHKGKFNKQLLGQINNRWVGLLDDANASWRVSGRAGVNAHLLTGTGDFIHLAPGAVQDRFQVAMATAADLDRLQRSDMAPPTFEPSKPIDPDVLPEASGEDSSGGRPREEIDMDKLAYYVVYGPGQVSKRQANEALGLGHILHYRYRDKAQEFLACGNRWHQLKRGAQNV